MIAAAAAGLLLGSLLVALTSAPASAAVFSNTAPITIPAGPGAAAPYPSGITVAGLGNVVSDVNVTISGLTHTWPDDVDILLVGPGGQHTILMADTGEQFNVTGVNLTFDDAAGGLLPDVTQISAGSFKPTRGTGGAPQGNALTTFPAPAPGPAYVTALSVFNGTNPNGTWNLYV